MIILSIFFTIISIISTIFLISYAGASFSLKRNNQRNIAFFLWTIFFSLFAVINTNLLLPMIRHIMFLSTSLFWRTINGISFMIIVEATFYPVIYVFKTILNMKYNSFIAGLVKGALIYLLALAVFIVMFNGVNAYFIEMHKISNNNNLIEVINNKHPKAIILDSSGNLLYKNATLMHIDKQDNVLILHADTEYGKVECGLEIEDGKLRVQNKICVPDEHKEILWLLVIVGALVIFYLEAMENIIDKELSMI